jgi:homoserine kinase
MIALVVPASLSNLGSGFDVVGFAVGLYNQFLVTPGGSAGRYEVDHGPVRADDHLLLRTVERAEAAFGRRLGVGLSVTVAEGVPRSRGLGSSATVRVAGVLAYCQVAAVEPPLDELLAFLTEEEGHPDNVCAAMLGGVTLAAREAGRVRAVRVEPPAGYTVALAVPERTLSTDEARAALADVVPREDAVFNLGRLAHLVHGLTTGDAASLRLGVQDRLHQAQRAALLGPVDAAVAAAHAAGAAGAFLSGSGSTMAALVPPDVDATEVARALATPLRSAGLGLVDARVVAPCTYGAWQLWRDARPA